MSIKYAVAGAAMALALAPTLALADASVSGVESARAKERQGAYLTGQQRDALRRYGNNDDYGPRYGFDYGRYDYGNDYYVDTYAYGPVVEFGYYPY